MIRIKNLIAGHHRDQILCLRQIDDIVRPARNHMDGFDLVSAHLNSASSLYRILASLVIPAGSNNVARISFVYFLTYFGTSGLVPTKLMSPPDVKVETTFFQRKFFSTTPSNYPQKQYKKRTSDLSEVPILRCFLKTLPLSTPLPASYQIPPNCTLNDISP